MAWPAEAPTISRHEQLLASQPRRPVKKSVVRKTTKSKTKGGKTRASKTATPKRKKKAPKQALSSPLLNHGIGNAAAAAACGTFLANLSNPALMLLI
jgi:hypothetical protein